MLAELVYHHVPQFEIDGGRRIQAVPCEGYQSIIRKGVATSVEVIFQEGDGEAAYFIIEERNIIVIGLFLDDFLFIAARGTRFFHDWKINFRASLGTSAALCYRYHAGFAKEAERVHSRIMEKIKKRNASVHCRCVHLTGHSLGGAVVGILSQIMKRDPVFVSSLLFASPRFTDKIGRRVYDERNGSNIRKAGDIIPSIPPRWLGFAELLYEYFPDGKDFSEVDVSDGHNYFIWRLALFTYRRFEPHDMRGYRRDVGIAVGSPLAAAELASYQKIKRKNVSEPVN